MDINYSITEQQKRIEESAILIDDNIINQIDNLNVNLNQSNNLSDKESISKQLERLANYILFCPGAERITKQTLYNFYNEKNLNTKINKEQNFDGMIDNLNKDKYGEILDYLIRKGNNYKKEIKQKIFKEDLSIPEIYEYEQAINSMRAKLKYLKENDLDTRMQKKLIHEIGRMHQDQIDCKDALRGTIYFNDVMPDSEDIDYDQFDFYDKQQVLALLRFSSHNITTDLGVLVYDLNVLLKYILLTAFEEEILRLYRKDYTIVQISEELNYKREYVSNTLNKISNLIIDKFDEVYEDWYYLNVVKGKYKKCTKCGQIKIASEKYFYKKEDNCDNFKNICIICLKSEK